MSGERTVCPVCNKCIRRNCRAISCDCCNKWIHMACANLNVADYCKLDTSTEALFV